ncbi:hypothetical protein T492DRAFT_834450 [Pavlovales sp. CCMP2436]|nr:hypothetical protein T492DRAFT_834450 [Pavlovales sp. CCMP2436]
MATYASQDGGRALCAEAEPIRAAGSVYFRQGHVGVAMNEWMKAIAKLMPVTNSGFSAVEQMVSEFALNLSPTHAKALVRRVKALASLPGRAGAAALAARAAVATAPELAGQADIQAALAKRAAQQPPAGVTVVEQRGAVPSGRWEHPLTELLGNLVLIGGFDKNSSKQGIDRLTEMLRTQVWACALPPSLANAPAMTTADLQHHSAAAAESSAAGAGASVPQQQQQQQHAVVWRELQCRGDGPPSALQYHSTCAYKGQLWLFAGQPTAGRCSDSLFVFTPNEPASGGSGGGSGGGGARLRGGVWRRICICLLYVFMRVCMADGDALYLTLGCPWMSDEAEDTTQDRMRAERWHADVWWVLPNHTYLRSQAACFLADVPLLGGGAAPVRCLCAFGCYRGYQRYYSGLHAFPLPQKVLF